MVNAQDMQQQQYPQQMGYYPNSENQSMVNMMTYNAGMNASQQNIRHPVKLAYPGKRIQSAVNTAGQSTAPYSAGRFAANNLMSAHGGAGGINSQFTTTTFDRDAKSAHAGQRMRYEQQRGGQEMFIDQRGGYM